MALFAILILLTIIIRARQLGWEGQISILLVTIISNNIINIHNSLYDYEA